MCKIQIRKIKLNRSTKFYVVRVDSGLRRKRAGSKNWEARASIHCEDEDH